MSLTSRVPDPLSDTEYQAPVPRRGADLRRLTQASLRSATCFPEGTVGQVTPVSGSDPLANQAPQLYPRQLQLLVGGGRPQASLPWKAPQTAGLQDNRKTRT